MTKWLSFLFCALLLTGCLDPVDLALRQETEKLVVEGLLTNELNPFLRLSLTTQFGNANTVEPLKGAYVEVRQAGGESVIFRSVPGELGLYKPDNRAFAGKPGGAYSLYLKLPDGREYRSDAQLLPVPVPIESLNATFGEGKQFGFQTYLDFRDPTKTPNFYRWTAFGYHQRRSKGIKVSYGPGVCCDRCWVREENSAINLFADALVDGSMVKGRPVFFSPFFTLGKHLIEVQQYSLSQQAYQYWSRYRDQQQRTGSIFDPLPAPLLGNVVNISDPNDIALGFFEVSGVTRKRIEPLANTQLVAAYNLENTDFVPEGDCMASFPFSIYTTINPPGW